MTIAKPNQLTKLKNIKVLFGCEYLVRVPSLKILGLHFDETMNWNNHISIVNKKCFGSLSRLFPLKYILSTENKLTIMNAYVLSHIRYGCVIWLSRNSNKTFKTIDKIIRCMSRFVLGLRKYDSVGKEICFTIEWLYSKYLYSFNLMCLLFKTLVFTDNDYFFNYVDLANKETRTTRNQTYLAPTLLTKSAWGSHAFSYAAADTWFKLPDYVKNSATTFNNFKNACYAYFLTKQIEETLYYYEENDDILSCIDHVIQSYSNL
jgi:hypothetical protein